MKLTEKIWNKEVKKNVIANLISGGIFFVFSQIIIIIWGLVNQINFKEFYKKGFEILKKSIAEKEWFLIIMIWILSLIVFVIFFILTKKLVLKFISINHKREKFETEITEAPTVFFNNRFRDAFPGFSNDYKWFESKGEIHKRLKILLKEPLKFDKGTGYGIDKRPIWWFRDSGTMPISKFKILNRKKILLNTDEYIVDKIAAYRGNSYFQDFVYVECSADKPTGLYEHDSSYINSRIKNNRGYQEEFGIFKNKFITRLEFDDCSALIKGKPVQTFGAELRSRSLTKYNFIISAKFSPYNSTDFRKNSGVLLGKLLRNEIQFNDFVEWMKELPKNPND